MGRDATAPGARRRRPIDERLLTAVRTAAGPRAVALDRAAEQLPEPLRADTTAMQVVAFFDALLDDHVDAVGLVRRAASFAGCPVGIRTPAGQVISAGMPAPRGPRTAPPGSIRCALRRGGEVWLDRPGDPRPQDAVLLQRLAVTAGVVLSRPSGPDGADRTALLEQVLSADTVDIERSRSLRGLRLTPAATVRVFAVAGPGDGVDALVAQIRAVSSTVHAAALSGITAVLAEEPAVAPKWDAPVGTRLAWSGAFPAAQAPAAWRQARIALRFTLPSTHPGGPYSDEEAVAVAAEFVGAFLALAEFLRAEDIATIADVQAVDRIVAEDGPAALAVLEAVAATESLRRAATRVHLHHNSVASRLRRAERTLGFDVSQPYGRCRLMLALVLRRLRNAEPIE